MRLLGLWLSVIFGLAGCQGDHSRQCETSADCLQGSDTGICAPSPTSGASFCAFPATDCGTGYRWGLLAGDGLADECVASLPPADAGPDAAGGDGGIPDAGGCTFGDTQPCGTAVGECEIGTQTCEASGVWGACEGGVQPVDELCNSLDDDCDGTTDNGLNACGGACALPGVPGSTCDGADGDSCAEGSWTCAGMNDLSCSDMTGTSVEACNGTDDDCNGATDEGCACIDGSMQLCGSAVGVCDQGMQTCASGMWGSCVGGVGPSVETCNDLDDDCNALTDETFPSKGMACTVGMGACTASATLVCSPDGSTTTCGTMPGPPSAEMCNGIDDDCDGMVDDGCPAQVVARFPWNGYTTGSVWATSGALAVKSRRPTFRWDAAPGSTYYQLQVDDTCTTPGFSGCAFPSAEIETMVFATSHTPASDLSVSTAVPVGRRYYWRVRACNAVGCSDWNLTRYVDVGRLSNDFNGDGYSDVVIGAPGQNNGATDEGNAYVHVGSSSGIAAAAAVTLDNPDNQAYGAFGASVAAVGDVNADGYSDLVVGARGQQDSMAESSEGQAFLYLGSAAGVASTYSVRLDNPTDTMNGQFGTVAGAGDVNGDGYADLIVSATGTLVAYVFSGSAAFADVPAAALLNAGTPSNGFGSAVATAGDVDGDGYVDVVVGAPTEDAPEADEGNAFVFLGSSTGVSPTPALALDNPEDEANGNFGVSVGSGDFNGDGYSDVLVGANTENEFASDDGAAFLFHGSSTGVASTPSADLPNPYGQAFSRYGASVAGVGDVNNTGYADALVSADYYDYPEMDEGNVMVLGGASTSLVGMPIRRLDNPVDYAYGKFGACVRPAGDVNGDGYADWIIGAPSVSNYGAVYIYHGATTLPTDPARTLLDPTSEISAYFGISVGGQ